MQKRQKRLDCLVFLVMGWGMWSTWPAWGDGPSSRLSAVVAAEDDVYAFTAANNGAGPMWCFGNTAVVRQGERVFVAGLHTLDGVPPLNNCVPSLYLGDGTGWRSVYLSAERTREPSPLGMFAGGAVFLSINPTKTPPDTYSGPAAPALLQFDPNAPEQSPTRLQPEWQGQPAFSEHSYRSLAVDGVQRELILLQNIDYTHAEYTFYDRTGVWSAAGRLAWPRDAVGKPVRICYPAVAVADRKVVVFGVTDVVEPNQEWQAAKRELTGNEWDYVFRRLYLTWCDDITQQEFHPWMEIANVEATAGQLFPNDLFVHANGDLSLLWSESSLDERLRERFYPTAKQRHALEWMRVRAGQTVRREAIVEQTAENRQRYPGRGRFHVTPDGRLFCLYFVQETDQRGQTVAHNQLVEIAPDGALGQPLSLDLKSPLSSFFTNSVRAGCEPSWLIDMLAQVGMTMRYARIELSH